MAKEMIGKVGKVDDGDEGRMGGWEDGKMHLNQGSNAPPFAIEVYV